MSAFSGSDIELGNISKSPRSSVKKGLGTHSPKSSFHVSTRSYDSVNEDEEEGELPVSRPVSSSSVSSTRERGLSSSTTAASPPFRGRRASAKNIDDIDGKITQLTHDSSHLSTTRQTLRESLKVKPKDVVHSAAALVDRVRNSVTRRRGSSMVDRAVDHKESKAWEENSKYVIDPESIFAFCWNSFLLVGRIYQCFVIPFRLAFDYEAATYGSVDISIHFLDVLFFFDLILKFRWGYMENGNKILNLGQIRVHRMNQKTLYTAFLAAIPIDIIFVYMVGFPRNELFATNKLLRLLELAKDLRNLEKSFILNPYIVRIIKVLFYAYFSTHMVACGYKLSCKPEYGSFDTPWCHLSKLGLGVSKRQMYFGCVYWSWGVMTGNAGGEIPSNNLQYVFTVCLMFAGVILFAFLTANFGQIMDNLSEATIKIMSDLARFTSFNSKHSLHADVSRRVVEYYEYIRKYGKFQTILAERKLLSELPDDLEVAIMDNLVGGILRKVDLFNFQELRDSNGLKIYVDDEGFVPSLLKKLHYRLASTDENVIHQGEQGYEIYFVLDGILGAYFKEKKYTITREVYYTDPVRVKQIEGGMYFGERALLDTEKERKRSSTVKAETYCNLYWLHVDDFNEIVGYFPGVKEMVKTVAQRKIDMDKAREDALRKEKAMKEKANFLKDIKAVKDNESILKGEKSVKALDPALLKAEEAKNKIVYKIDTYGSYKMLWFQAMVWVILFITMELPFRAAFVGNMFFFELLAFDLVAETFLFIHMVQSFRWPYMKHSGVIEDKPVAIVVHYLKGYFLLDFLGWFPLDYLMYLVMGYQYNVFYKLNKLLWTRHIFRFINIVKTKSPYQGLYTAASLLLGFIIISHVVACIYWTYTKIEGFGYYPNEVDIAWLPSQTIANATYFIQYGRSLYFSTSALSSLGKDIAPDTENELFFMIIVMMAGVMIVAYLISTVGLLLTSADANEAAFRSKRLRMEVFMKGRKIDRKIVIRVNRFYDLVWKMQRGNDFNSILDALPKDITSKVKGEIFNKDTVRDIILKSIDNSKQIEDDLINLITGKLRLELYPQSEYIVKYGEVGDKMFFISKGLCQIVTHVPLDTPNVEPFKKVIGVGAYFGELALLYGRRKANVVAFTMCELMALSKEDFYDCLNGFPEVKAAFYEVADTRFDHMRREVLETQLKTEESLLKEKKSKSVNERTPSSTDLSLLGKASKIVSGLSALSSKAKKKYSGGDGDFEFNNPAFGNTLVRSPSTTDPSSPVVSPGVKKSPATSPVTSPPETPSIDRGKKRPSALTDVTSTAGGEHAVLLSPRSSHITTDHNLKLDLALTKLRDAIKSVRSGKDLRGIPELEAAVDWMTKAMKKRTFTTVR